MTWYWLTHKSTLAIPCQPAVQRTIHSICWYANYLRFFTKIISVFLVQFFPRGGRKYPKEPILPGPFLFRRHFLTPFSVPCLPPCLPPFSLPFLPHFPYHFYALLSGPYCRLMSIIWYDVLCESMTWYWFTHKPALAIRWQFSEPYIVYAGMQIISVSLTKIISVFWFNFFPVMVESIQKSQSCPSCYGLWYTSLPHFPYHAYPHVYPHFLYHSYPHFPYHFYPYFPYYSYPLFSYHSYPHWHFRRQAYPLYHQPRFLQHCVNVSRPCPQC